MKGCLADCGLNAAPQCRTAFDEGYLDGEFDPEDWDKKMSTLFNEEFYDDVDVCPAGTNDRPCPTHRLSRSCMHLPACRDCC